MPELNVPKSEVGILFDDIISEYKKGNVSLENIEIPFDRMTHDELILHEFTPNKMTICHSTETTEIIIKVKVINKSSLRIPTRAII